MAAFKLEQEVVYGQDAVVLRISGSLDAYSFQELEEAIGALLEAGRYRLIADLSEVEYLSSAGIGILISAMTQAREANGTVIIESPSEVVVQMFQDAGLYEVLTIAPDRAGSLAALAALAAQSA